MRVLVVDDNELVLEVAKSALCAAGFEVIASDSALGFSAALAESRPDVALVDVLMPALNGNHLVDLARRRQRRRRTAIPKRHGSPECIFVLHSNLPESDLQELTRRCGALGYIQKSPRPGELGVQLHEFLRRHGIDSPSAEPLSNERKTRR